MIFVSSGQLTVGAGDSLVGNGYCIEVVTEFDELGFDVEQQQQPLEVFREGVEHRAVGVNHVGLVVLHCLRIMVMGGSDVKYARVAYGFDTREVQRSGIIALVTNANRTAATR